MQTNPAAEQNKNIKWSDSGEISHPVREKKVYGGKDLSKSQIMSSEWKTEGVNENENDDSEDDNLQYVKGSKSEEDCIW